MQLSQVLGGGGPVCVRHRPWLVLPFYHLPASPEQAQELTGPKTIPGMVQPWQLSVILGGDRLFWGSSTASVSPQCWQPGSIHHIVVPLLPLLTGFIPKLVSQLSHPPQSKGDVTSAVPRMDFFSSPVQQWEVTAAGHTCHWDCSASAGRAVGLSSSGEPAPDHLRAPDHLISRLLTSRINVVNPQKPHTDLTSWAALLERSFLCLCLCLHFLLCI